MLVYKVGRLLKDVKLDKGTAYADHVVLVLLYDDQRDECAVRIDGHVYTIDAANVALTDCTISA